MRYFGGKYRVRKQIAGVINTYNPKVYLEPFCGSAWVAELVSAETIVLCDLNEDLIELYKYVQDGGDLPDHISEEEYRFIKTLEPPHYLRAFAGFGCSYSGKYFGGYARGGHGADAATAKSQLERRDAATAKSQLERRYAATAKSQLERRYAATAKSQLADALTYCMDYRQAMETFPADVVYCDPPYNDTTKFYGLPNFNTEEFWEVMRKASMDRVVLISEYEAPADFTPILSIPTRTDIRGKNGTLIPRVERVYKYSNGVA